MVTLVMLAASLANEARENRAQTLAYGGSRLDSFTISCLQSPHHRRALSKQLVVVCIKADRTDQRALLFEILAVCKTSLLNAERLF